MGLKAGHLLVEAGHEVYGIRRSKDCSLASSGIHPIIGDVTCDRFWDHLNPEFDWVINCLSSGRGDADVYKSVYLDTSQRLMRWLHHTQTQKYVYTSSTSVLGQTDGSVVTEDSPTSPLTETARVLVETEQVLIEASRNDEIPTVILRLSGIYGPERGFLFSKFIKGEATLADSGKRFINMIHRDDAASGIVAACESGIPGNIYHITDNEAVTQHDYFTWLCSKTGLAFPSAPTPPATKDSQSQEPVSSTSPSKKRSPTNKQVSNRKAREQLGWNPGFPTFREGYQPRIDAFLAAQSSKKKSSG